MQIALPAPLLAPLPPDAIALRPQAELELDPHLSLAQGDQLIITPRTRPPPQRPGDGVEQCRFAVPVVAGQAREVDAAEVERLLVAVAHEVREAEFVWDHGNLESGIRDQEAGATRRTTASCRNHRKLYVFNSPCCISQCFTDICRFQVWIRMQNIR